MKLIFRLIKIAIIFLIIGCCFYLLINKTFIYDVYKSEVMEGEGIPIKRFMRSTSDLRSRLPSLRFRKLIGWVTRLC